MEFAKRQRRKYVLSAQRQAAKLARIAARQRAKDYRRAEMLSTHRRCRICGQIKSFDADHFFTVRGKPQGRQCRYCLYQRKRASARPDSSYPRQNIDATTDTVRLCTRCGIVKPFDGANFKLKRGRPMGHKCRECNSKYTAMWRAKNPRKRVAISDIDRLRNRMSSRMRSYLRRAVDEKKHGKSWTSLTGYTPSMLRQHIERQFLKGMGWHNMHLWHIDHIIPLSSFKITSNSCVEFKAAWALTNLRPLWALDNLKKNAKRLHLI